MTGWLPWVGDTLLVVLALAAYRWCRASCLLAIAGDAALQLASRVIYLVVVLPVLLSNPNASETVSVQVPWVIGTLAHHGFQIATVALLIGDLRRRHARQAAAEALVERLAALRLRHRRKVVIRHPRPEPRELGWGYRA